MLDKIDNIKINFSEDSLFLLNVCLAIIMFGIALEIKLVDFNNLIKNPKGAIVGLSAQFIALPLVTFLLILLFKPTASIALGMILVAACPGGNISNFMSHLSGSNAALSVSLTSVATFLALIFTPLNFEFYGHLYGPTSQLLQNIELDPWEVVKTILLIILIPLIAGVLVQKQLPKLAAKVAPSFRTMSILIFLGFVAVAFANNFDLFLEHVGAVALLVFIHNALALSTGYGLARVSGLDQRDSRTLAIETGIQNSGLGLVLIFTFFDGLGGMALVTAWWGIWHILSGLSIAFFWSRRKLRSELSNS
jgi:BASS family bile acid:Na+ symporter